MKNALATTYVDTKPSENNLILVMSVETIKRTEVSNIVDHEFGHVVDWYKGYPAGENDFICLIGSAKWCHSSQKPSFIEAYAELYNETILGYGSLDKQEMFAEFFGEMFPDSTNRSELFYEKILNFYFDDSPHTGYRFVKNGTAIDAGAAYNYKETAHNSLMYVHLYVSTMANFANRFPGQIIVDDQATFQEGDVKQANYMNGKAVVSLKLNDHKGVLMEKVVVNLGESQETREKDLTIQNAAIQTKGTAIFNGVSTNYPSGQIVTIKSTPDYYRSSNFTPVFAGQRARLRSGSNYIEVKYRALVTQYIVRPNTYPMGIFSPEFPPPPQFAGTFEIKDGTKIKGTAKGSIPRYPDEGTDGGVGVWDTNQNNLARSQGVKNAWYYRIGWIVGGDDEFIFPAKASLKGPAGLGSFNAPPGVNVPPPNTITQQYINTGSLSLVEGIINKRCFHDPYNKPWPWCNESLPWSF